MTDTINLYPKTSCSTWACKKEYPIPQNSVKSNLSFMGCQTPDYFGCYSTVEIKTNQQPQNEYGWNTLNPDAYNSKIDPSFHYPRSGGRADIKSCSEKGWVSENPKQFDVLRYQSIILDRPPTNGNVNLIDVYSDKYNNYGNLQTGGYSEYENIIDGDVTYYVDKSIKDAFYHPVFAEPAIASTILYQDPMSAMRPQYERKAVINTENPTTTTPKYYPYSLSFIQDSQSYREDLMALQQRKHNESKWSARWS